MPDSPYTDDPHRIPAGSRVIRRVNPRFIDWNTLNEGGHPRVTTQAAQFYNQQMALRAGCPAPALSVIVPALADPIEQLIERYAGEGLSYLDADLVRGNNERGIQLWPTTQEPHAHAVVFRLDGGSDLSKPVKRMFAEYMTEHWIIVPDPVI